MVNQLHLNFLREKISDLQSALLYNMSRSVLKLPTSVVLATHVDDMGFIWLLAHRPAQDIKEFERNFPVNLNFYQKGIPYYLNVSGKASIVLEPSEIDEMQENTTASSNYVGDEWMFIKVEITDAEYHGAMEQSSERGWIPALSSYWNKLFSTQQNDHKTLAIH